MNKQKDFTVVSMKIKLTDLEKLKRCAKKYTDGNLSAWLRLAGLAYTPSEEILKRAMRRKAKRPVDDEEDFF